MQDLWRGNANAWECDELGHLNVRFYAEKAMQAVGRITDEIGMEGAFTAGAMSTLIPRELHIRFLAEARPGAPLSIAGGVTSVTETGLTVVLIMQHAARDTPAATLQMSFEHAEPRSGRPFAWPQRMRSALAKLQIETPAIAEPRGLALTDPARTVSRQQADALGLAEVGFGRFSPEDCDPFGRMRAEAAIGKVSDTVIHFRQGFPEQWANHVSGAPLTEAAALLEARLVFRSFPRAGDGFVLRSGLKSASEKVRTLIHWVLDPVSGRALWSMEGVACIMDLEQRKLRQADLDMLQQLQASIIPELRV